MPETHCPGQDLRLWKPEDIFDVPCPACGAYVEIWKDEAVRTCHRCRASVRNPRLNLGCAKWCAHAKECLAQLNPKPPTEPRA